MLLFFAKVGTPYLLFYKAGRKKDWYPYPLFKGSRYEDCCIACFYSVEYTHFFTKRVLYKAGMGTCFFTKQVVSKVGAPVIFLGKRVCSTLSFYDTPNIYQCRKALGGLSCPIFPPTYIILISVVYLLIDQSIGVAQAKWYNFIYCVLCALF